ncbi:Sister chromatid cohesion protein PDS5 [Spathaspora sp. JA1]|nr:Sister chromatid cohesion protein PDS5 [Spathaspora sp. JA1]
MTSAKSKFKFTKSLVPTVKDPISTKELLHRVQTLSEQLSILESIDTADISRIQVDLVNKKLLQHTSVGVQIYVCCCLADVLRLNAPKAPYSTNQISDVFKVFIKQFKRLVETNNTYFQQYCYLLKRLVEAKSVILITDVPDSEMLIELLFQTFYNLIKHQDFPMQLESLITDVLSEVISEAEVIPHNVIDLVLNKFLLHSEESKLVQGNITSPEFTISVTICENNIDRLSRLVGQYFSEILYSASDDENTIDLTKLTKIHKLSIQLWKFIPDILASVINLLDDELNAEDEQIRLLATTTIGSMLGSNTSKSNFFVLHKQIWINWLRKTSDISPVVRSKWVEQIPAIITHNKYLSLENTSALSTCLHKCLVDIDDKVRMAGCISIKQIPNDKKFLTKDILQDLFQTIREKNMIIRNASIEILGKLYNNTLSDSELGELINNIPSQILNLIYINDKEINCMVDSTLFESLLPLTETDSAKRVDRLVKVYSGLDERGKEAFIAINNRQVQFSKVLTNLIEIGENFSNDKLAKLTKILNWICISFPESSFSCFERLVKLQRPRFFHLIKLCISPESDINTVRNSIKELLKKLADSKNIQIPGEEAISSSDMIYNVKLLLLRASVLCFNKSNIEQLITNQTSTANEILEQISLVVPEVFKSNITSLIRLIEQDNCSNVLKTIYHFVKKFPKYFPKQVSFIESLKKLARQGDPIEARYAVKIIGISENKELYTAQIVSDVYPLNLKSEYFTTHLSSIGELFKVDQLSVLDKEVEITELLIKNLFLKNRNLDREITNEWISDDKLTSHPTLYEKLLAIRLFVNNLKVVSDDLSEEDQAKAKAKAQPVTRLLMSFIGNNGEIINKNDKSYPTPEPYKSKLRLYAGIYLLKLAKVPVYNELLFLPPTIRRMTFLINDGEYQVRHKFITDLQRKLVDESISSKFLPMIFFTAIEPDLQLKENVTIWINSMNKRNRVKFEKVLVRLIHILAHHEQFLELYEQTPLQAYNFVGKFLIHYTKLIAKSDNISLLYYLSSRIKQYRDGSLATSDYETTPLPQQALHLYRIAELSQLIIKQYSDDKNWPLTTWPGGKIQLPNDIYAPMSSPEEARSIVSTVFISEDIQSEVLNSIRKKLHGSKRKSTSVQVSAPKRKTVKPVKAKPAKT